MASLPPPELYYGNPSHFHAANQHDAIRNAIFLNLGYLPIYFLALCIYKNPNIVRRYKTTIVFAGVVQYVLTLPYTIFNTWLAIYVNHEVETTVFLCTFIRMGTSVLNFISFNALTAISISRLLMIVFKLNCGLLWNILFFTVASLPILADIVYMFFVSKPSNNAICGPLLFYYELAPMLLWNGYIFGIPLIAVLLNSITAGYLLYKRYSAEPYLKNSRRTVNELFIAAALLVQSVIPALTMSSKGYRSIQDIYGVRADPWLKELIETSGYMTTGLNMVASMICIKHFRQMFKQLVLRDKSISKVGDVTTSACLPNVSVSGSSSAPMVSLPPPQIYYGNPSYFHAAYQSIAIRSAILLNLGYIPIYFLAVCIHQNPNIVKRYKTTIVFAGVVQYALSLPYTVFNTWMAVYVNQEVQTTVFMCTFIRMSTSLLNFISFNALTAISISRLFIIIFKINLDRLVWNILFFIVASLPVLTVVYMFFVSRPIENTICGPVLFYYEFVPIMIWNGYIFAIPLIAVLLNSVTAGYLLYKRYSSGSKDAHLNSSHRTVNELFIAGAMLIQSVIPALTMSTKGYRSILEVYGLQTLPWLKDLIDTSGDVTTGLNMLASMICIKHFRQMFKQLVLREKTVTRIGDNTTVTVRLT